VAYRLRLTEKQAQAVLDELVSARLIEWDGQSYLMHDWEEWQFDSDANLTPGRATKNEAGSKERGKNAEPPRKERHSAAQIREEKSREDQRRGEGAPNGATPPGDLLPFEPPPDADLEPEPAKGRARPISAIGPYLPELIDKHPTINVPLQFEKFQNHVKAKGRPFKDYVAAFRNWLINEEGYQSERNGRSQAIGAVARAGAGRSLTDADLDAWDAYKRGE
jgi:hypothetical protein